MAGLQPCKGPGVRQRNFRNERKGGCFWSDPLLRPTQLLTSGCKCSIATHDRSIQEDLTSLIRKQFLYVLNRIAEDPLRIYQARHVNQLIAQLGLSH